MVINEREKKGEKRSEIKHVTFLFGYLTNLMREEKKNENQFLLDPPI